MHGYSSKGSDKKNTTADKQSDNAKSNLAAAHRESNPFWHDLALRSYPFPTKPVNTSSSTLIQRITNENEEVQEDGELPVVQAKLAIAAADDPHEREADEIAEKVMRFPAQNLTADDNQIQRKPSVLQLQRSKHNAANSPAVSPKLQQYIQRPGAGSPIDSNVRHRIEPILGSDLSGVQVHNDTHSQQAAKSINAKAFTHRNNIFMGAGQSNQDVRLMAHEATHTVQQLGATKTENCKAAGGTQSSDSIYLDRIDDIIENYEDLGGLNLQEEALGAHLADLIRDGNLATASAVLSRLTTGDAQQVAAATIESLSESERASLGNNADAFAFHNAVSDYIISGHTGIVDLDETALGITIAGHVRANRFDLARQTINHLPSGQRDEVAEALFDELTSAELRVLANSVEGADLVHTMLDGLSGGIETDEEEHAISILSETVLNEREAIIPIISLIALIRQLERQYPDDSREQMLTRIRQEYYPGDAYIALAFDNLIPDAPIMESYEADDGLGGTTTARRRRTLEHMPDRQNRQYSHGLLTSHATENDPAGGDNPSPYIELPNGEKVDFGHFLLGLDALVHPRTGSPYSDYGISNIDPSSWVADIGIAAVWHDQHVDEGEIPSGVPPNAPSTPNFDQYYLMSAPEEDLISDVDSFGAHQTWQDYSGAKLSEVLEQYYIGPAGTGNTSGVSHRWRTFCNANGFAYSQVGSTITWDPALSPRLITRVDRFNDMFAAGSFRGVATLTAGYTVSRRSWPSTPLAVNKFLAWVKRGLEAELARAP